jgi:hypothetical protein
MDVLDAPHDASRPTICIDCDEVLALFIPALAEWHNRTYGTLLQARSFSSTHFAGVPGFGDAIETDAKMHAFFQSEEWLNLSPVAGAAEALPRLAARFNLYLVTARSPRQEAVTRAWLGRNFAPVFCGLRFTGAYDNPELADKPKRTKGQVCAELGALCLVDDSATYSLEAAGHLPFVVCFGRYAWNSNREEWEHPRLPVNVLRAATWEHVEALLARAADAVAARGGGGGVRPRAGAEKPVFYQHEVDLTVGGGLCPWAVVAAGCEEAAREGAGGGGAASLPPLRERDGAAALRDALLLHQRTRARIPSLEQLAARGVADGAAARAAAIAALQAALGATPGATAKQVEAEDGGGDVFDVAVAGK